MTVSGALLSGVITVTTAGTAVHETGDMASIPGTFYIEGHPANTGVVYVGNDGAGDVAVGNGYALNPGQQIYFSGVLTSLWCDAATNGDKVCWFRAG